MKLETCHEVCENYQIWKDLLVLETGLEYGKAAAPHIGP